MQSVQVTHDSYMAKLTMQTMNSSAIADATVLLSIVCIVSFVHAPSLVVSQFQDCTLALSLHPSQKLSQRQLHTWAWYLKT